MAFDRHNVDDAITKWARHHGMVSTSHARSDEHVLHQIIWDQRELRVRRARSDRPSRARYVHVSPRHREVHRRALISDVDPLTTYIDFARSLVERDRRIHRNIRMAPRIEIKGFAGLMQSARDAISEARQSTTSLQGEAAAFAQDVNDVRAQIKKHHDDFLFDVGTLGNGGPATGSENSPPPVDKPVAEQQAAPEGPMAPHYATAPRR